MVSEKNQIDKPRAKQDDDDCEKKCGEEKGPGGKKVLGI